MTTVQMSADGHLSYDLSSAIPASPCTYNVYLQDRGPMPVNGDRMTWSPDAVVIWSGKAPVAYFAAHKIESVVRVLVIPNNPTDQ